MTTVALFVPFQILLESVSPGIDTAENGSSKLSLKEDGQNMSESKGRWDNAAELAALHESCQGRRHLLGPCCAPPDCRGALLARPA